MCTGIAAVCCRLQMRVEASESQARADGAPTARGKPTVMPKRGIWAIDQLKHVAQPEDLHVIGVDPGKHEVSVGVSEWKSPRASSPPCQKAPVRMFTSWLALVCVLCDCVRVSLAACGMCGHGRR